MYSLFLKSNKKRAKKRAFTLVELIIVIVILGILAGVAALSFTNVTQSSKDGVAKANLRAVKSAVQVYSVDNKGVLPQSKENLENYCDPALYAEIMGTVTPASGYTYTLTPNADPATLVTLKVEGGGISPAYTLEIK